jgi:hypothetical protein
MDMGGMDMGGMDMGYGDDGVMDGAMDMGYGDDGVMDGADGFDSEMGFFMDADSDYEETEEEDDYYFTPQMYNGVMYYTQSDYNAAIGGGGAAPGGGGAIYGGVGIPYQAGILFDGNPYFDESAYNTAIGGGGGGSEGDGGGASDGIAGSDTSVMYANGVTTTGTSSDDTIIVGGFAGSIVTTGGGEDLLHADVANGNYQWAGLHQSIPVNPGIDPSVVTNPLGTSWYGMTNSGLLSDATTNFTNLNMVTDFAQGSDKIEISNSALGLETGYNHMSFSGSPGFAGDASHNHGTVLNDNTANTAIDTYFNSGYNVSGAVETGVTILYIAGTSEMLFGIAGEVTLTSDDFFNSVA